MGTKEKKNGEQLLTESEAGLITKYIGLRKTLSHIGAILKITQEERRSFGDVEEAIKKITAKVFAAYLQKMVEESTFKAQTPRETKMVTCQIINGSRCSICGSCIPPMEDVCGQGHIINQQYPSYGG